MTVLVRPSAVRSLTQLFIPTEATLTFSISLQIFAISRHVEYSCSYLKRVLSEAVAVEIPVLMDTYLFTRYEQSAAKGFFVCFALDILAVWHGHVARSDNEDDCAIIYK
jgi:hypothetical protein